MKNIIVGSLLLSASILFANDYDMFIGAEYGKYSSEWSVGKKGDEIDTFGIRAGLVDEHTRIYMIFDYLDTEEPAGVDETVYLSTINLEAQTEAYRVADWLRPRFFVGGHAGLIDYALKTTSVDIDEMGLLYGAQAGILAGLPSDVDLEIGYRYSLSTLAVDGVDLDNANAYYVAINLAF